uniref:Uncharacterized protein n=1 Tax=Lepeophtheirus salmonis TaxID=72036 RepID=A0A0K2VIR7_LEPSM
MFLGDNLSIPIYNFLTFLNYLSVWYILDNLMQGIMNISVFENI